jgi:3'(2'), 5'-bisphosphate nucleotidase
MIAEGSADEYPRLGHTNEWDTAAAQAIVEASGKRVTILDGMIDTGNPLVYNKADLLNPWFIVK